MREVKFPNSLSNSKLKTGDRTHHLLFELHSSGNICLTDADYRVLTLLRSHKFSNAEGGAAAGASSEAGTAPAPAPASSSTTGKNKSVATSSSTAVAVAIAANRPYPIGAVVRPRSRLTAEALRAALISEAKDAAACDDGGGGGNGTTAAAAKKKKKKRKAPSNSLKALLSRAMPHGPAIAEHVAVAAGLDPERDVSDSREAEADEEGGGHSPPRLSLSDGEVEALLRAAAGVEEWIDRCEAVVGETLVAEGEEGGGGSKAEVKEEKEKGAAAAAVVEPPSGYLTVESGEPASVPLSNGDDESAHPSPSVVYDTFEAFPLAQHEKKNVGESESESGGGAERTTTSIPFATFDEAVDEYFSKIARQREAAAARSRDAAIAARGERIAADQARRAEQLQREADDARAAAEALEAALGDAEEAIGAVVSALASGARWDELERTIKAEAAAGNPVASRVASLDLKKNRACLWLPRVKTGGDGEEKQQTGDGEGEEQADLLSPALIRFDVDLSLTAHANAAALHSRRRAALLKLEKTREGHARAAAAAAASAESQRRAAAASAASRDAARAFRPLWFQRFDWFLTSEGYLVLCGRDSVRGFFFVFFLKGREF